MMLKSHHLDCKIEVHELLYDKHINCTGDCSHFFCIFFTNSKHIYHGKENVWGRGGGGMGHLKSIV